MSEDQDTMVQEIQLNKTPKIWLDLCYETMKPFSSWFEDFEARCQFWQGWSEGQKPVHFPLGYFFFP